MEYAVGVILLAGVATFVYGLGIAVGSDGIDSGIAYAGVITIVVCMVWFWGYLCGLPSIEIEEVEKEESE